MSSEVNRTVTQRLDELQHSDSIRPTYKGADKIPEDCWNRKAHKGYVYQCVHCGKKSRDKYGMDAISYGYDESCALNCVLVKETS